MALTATVYTFVIDLADSDRRVYESLELRVARHPSETAEYLVTRVLAYCLEYADGIAFSKGLCDPDDPAIAVRDPDGSLRVWIDIGAPDAARLHGASKAARRVAVYTHRDPTQWLRSLRGERIHRAADLELYAFDRRVIAAVAERLERRMDLSVAVTERDLFVSSGTETVTTPVSRLTLAGP